MYVSKTSSQGTLCRKGIILLNKESLLAVMCSTLLAFKSMPDLDCKKLYVLVIILLKLSPSHVNIAKVFVCHIKYKLSSFWNYVLQYGKFLSPPFCLPKLPNPSFIEIWLWDGKRFKHFPSFTMVAIELKRNLYYRCNTVAFYLRQSI